MVKNKNNKKIVVAMSGGVDSSVTATLLKKQGYDVVGVFMKFWKPRIYADSNADLRGYGNRCCTPESEKRARQVAKILDIPFYVFSFEKEFKKRVVDYFLKTNKQGKTPNPCVICNKEIKFGLLLERALKLGAGYVATGHYATIREVKNRKGDIIYKLLKGRDKQKDQSYFLWKLNQKQLKHILFPVGDCIKPQVRALARKFKLSVVETPESQEICFIQTTVNDFLRDYIKAKPGKIVDAKGNILGEHQGLWFYTIGQRKGLEINRAAKIVPGKPFYVLDKDIKKNLLVVTQNEKDLLQKELIAKDVIWISGKTPKLPLKVQAKIRYRSPSVSATIIKHQTPNTYHLKFSKPQRAITSGQSVVFYRREELLGGGIIK